MTELVELQVATFGKFILVILLALGLSKAVMKCMSWKNFGGIFVGEEVSILLRNIFPALDRAF